MIRGLVTTAYLTVTCWWPSWVVAMLVAVKSMAMLMVLVGIMGDD